VIFVRVGTSDFANTKTFNNNGLRDRPYPGVPGALCVNFCRPIQWHAVYASCTVDYVPQRRRRRRPVVRLPLNTAQPPTDRLRPDREREGECVHCVFHQPAIMVVRRISPSTSCSSRGGGGQAAPVTGTAGSDPRFANAAADRVLQINEVNLARRSVRLEQNEQRCLHCRCAAPRRAAPVYSSLIKLATTTCCRASRT